MHVLIIHPRVYIYGGAELVIVKLANYLTNQGIETTFLTTEMIPEVDKDLTGTKVINLGKPAINYFELGETWKLNRNIIKLIDNVDIINPHNFPAELALFRTAKKPVVWMCNEPPDLAMGLDQEPVAWKKLVKKTIFEIDKHNVKKYIKNVVVADKFNVDRFQNIYGITPVIIPYGIDCDYFSSVPKEKPKLDFEREKSFVILQVGTLTPLKNQLESLKTVEKLRKKIPGIKLILAGWGKPGYMDTLKKYIKDNNLAETVFITGHLDRDEIRKLYHFANLLLHPIKPQGGWLAPFEAMCSGLPIIASKELSSKEIIENESLGIVTDDYEDAILQVHGNPAKYCAMAEKGKLWVRENLSWDKFCEKMLNMFNKIKVK